MPSFSQLYQEDTEPFFTPREDRQLTVRCPLAEQFYQWAQEVVREPVTNPTHITINQAMLTITRKYREWRNTVPKTHKNRIGETGHLCIFHVWDECMRALEAAELTLAPPQLYLPQPVKKPRRKKEPEPPKSDPYSMMLGDVNG